MNSTTESEPRYSERLVVMERPDVAARIRDAAASSGHSTAAEIRQAVRAWLARDPKGA